ncbi:hypothetical protein [Nocardioides nanhaiensis]|uniref:DUF3558 domain-containing protein n=1 Tax=Nocardioides nanhaiensis TaxID=1476871 RepID=A0ABP8W5Z4_9ACTN
MTREHHPRTHLLRAALLAAVAPLLLACGDDAPRTTTVSDPPPRPSSVPAADGEVVTVLPALVIDDGGGTEICLGAVAESYPPQCSGPELRDWDWAEHEGDYEEAAGQRFSTFLVRGTWDGTAMTATAIAPGSGSTPFEQEPPPVPAEGPARSEEQLRGIAEDLLAIEGMLDASPEGGRVIAHAVHDDGTVQQWADDTYGEGVVVVSSALEPA